MNDELTIRSGIRDVMPTVFGYITVGMAYGIVAKTGHLSLLMIGLMSLIVYAGSAQFVLVSMLATGSPTVSYTHLRAHETRHDLVCRLLLEKKKRKDAVRDSVYIIDE